MGRNLGPLNIKDSYEGLAQISGSQLTDGSGSLISDLNVTASDATLAQTASLALALEGGVSLQSVLDTGNTATEDINLTGDINATTVTASLQGDVDGNASTATTASYALTASVLEGGVSLQTVLDTGNSATQSINLQGDVSASNIKVPTGGIVYTNDALTSGFLDNTVAIVSDTSDPVLTMNLKNALSYDRADDQFDLGGGSGGADVRIGQQRTLIFTAADSKISGSQAIIGQITGSTQQNTGQLRLGANAAVDSNNAISIENTDYGSVYFNVKRNSVDQIRMISTNTQNFIRIESSGSQESRLDLYGDNENVIQASGADLTIKTNDGENITIGEANDAYTKNVNITGSDVNIQGINYPTADGTTGQAVVTDGSGNLSFADRNPGLVEGDGSEALASALTTTPAKAEGDGSIAIGDNAVVTGSSSSNTVAIGKDVDSKDNSVRNVIIGYNAYMSEANRNDSVIIGANANGYQEGVAIGADSFTIFQAVSIGKSTVANDNYAVAVGAGANVANQGGIALGRNADSDGNYAIAIGFGAVASATGDVTIHNGYKDNFKYDYSADDTKISGSLTVTGQINGDGSGITGVSAQFDGHKYLDYQSYSNVNYPTFKQVQQELSSSFRDTITEASMTTASIQTINADAALALGIDGKYYYLGSNKVERLTSAFADDGDFGAVTLPTNTYIYSNTLKIAPENILFTSKNDSSNTGFDMVLVNTDSQTSELVSYPTDWENSGHTDGIVTQLFNDPTHHEVLWGVRNDGAFCYAKLDLQYDTDQSVSITGYSSSLDLNFSSSDATFNDETIFAQGQAPNGDILIISRQTVISGGNARYRLHAITTEYWDGDYDNIDGSVKAISTGYGPQVANGKYLNPASQIFFGGQYNGTFNGAETPYIVRDGSGTELDTIAYDWRNRRITWDDSSGDPFTKILDIDSVAGTFDRPTFTGWSPDKQIYWLVRVSGNTKLYRYDPFAANNNEIGTLTGVNLTGVNGIISPEGKFIFQTQSSKLIIVGDGTSNFTDSVDAAAIVNNFGHNIYR